MVKKKSTAQIVNEEHGIYGKDKGKEKKLETEIEEARNGDKPTVRKKAIRNKTSKEGLEIETGKATDGDGDKKWQMPGLRDIPWILSLIAPIVIATLIWKLLGSVIAIIGIGVGVLIWWMRNKEEATETTTSEKIEAEPTKSVIIKSSIVTGIFTEIALILFGFQIIDQWTAVAVVVLGAAYSFSCCETIGGEEKAIKTRFKRPLPDKIFTSGLHWLWRPIEWFYKFPTEEQEIDIPSQEVITAKRIMEVDTIVTDKKTGTSSIKKVLKEYSEAIITIDGTFLYFWPDTAKGLVDAYKKAPNPNNEQRLFKFFTNPIAAILRRVSGRYSWLEVREGTPEYLDKLHKEITKEKMSPIIKAGIDEFRVYNTKVKLPEDLEKSITGPQVAALDKQSAITTAEAERIKLEEEGKGKAAARKAIFQAVEESEQGATLEALLTLREMAQGQASTIFYELPVEITGQIGKALKGKETADELLQAYKLLSPGTQKLVKEFIDKKGSSGGK